MISKMKVWFPRVAAVMAHLSRENLKFQGKHLVKTVYDFVLNTNCTTGHFGARQGTTVQLYSQEGEVVKTTKNLNRKHVNTKIQNLTIKYQK